MAMRAVATHAGMPTPLQAAPQIASPGCVATAARILATRSRCPTVYWGSAPPQRVTRVTTGPPRTPVALGKFRGGQRGQIVIVSLQQRFLADAAD